MRALAVPLRGGPCGDGRVAGDENAGVQEQEAGQGRGARHLGLAWGAVGESGGFPWTGWARAGPAERGPAQDGARPPLPERAGLGRGGGCAAGAERLQRR